jgi:hypothetical protein
VRLNVRGKDGQVVIGKAVKMSELGAEGAKRAASFYSVGRCWLTLSNPNVETALN